MTGSLPLIFALLALCSAFFSSSETALFSLSKLQAHKFRETEGSVGAKIIALLKSPRETLVTILFGNELANVCLSIVGAAIVSRLMGGSARAEMLVAVATITPIVMVFCEIIPKNLALRFSEHVARLVALPISAFARAIAPLRIVLTWTAQRMVLLFGGSIESSEPMVMEEEYRRLVDLGLKQGAIEEEEREIIHNVFEFTDKRARDIMTPAEKIFSLPVGLSYERMMEELGSTQYSRVLFYDGERSRITGILHVRDLFTFNMRKRAGQTPLLEDYLREPLFVDASIPLEELLREFQRTGMHMAVVREAGGDVAGLVTMDDVQEELFGEIED